MVRGEARFDLLPLPARDVLGEGPWWSVGQQCLFRVDILGRRVHRTGLDGDRAESWASPEEVGFVVPNEAGDLLIGLRDGLRWLDPESGETTPDTPVEAERGEYRINDGKTDRRGRVWFGTMHKGETEGHASLYRYDSHGLGAVIRGITTSNGLGWSPDDTVMYHTDSISRRIMAYDFDADSAELRGGRLFAEDPAGYVPDGLTVDSEGCVWGAKWDGGKVVRYAPDGRVDRELTLPVSRPTSCMFVGPDLRTLAVTSARPAPAEGAREELAGSVFLVETGAQGLPERPTIMPSRGPESSHPLSPSQ